MVETISNLAKGAKSPRRIWSIGGGKGGTGKTFIAANLGLLLSENHLRVNMIDADLGAPNLHTFLGVRKPHLTLGDFIYKKGGTLAEVMSDTCRPGLKLAAGSNQHLYMANLRYFQKLKLLRHIKKLNHGHTIIDTGGGIYFNGLDFFPISDLGVLVINPDPASIENAYQFLRSVTLRILKFSVREHEIDALIKRTVEGRHRVPKSIQGLLELVHSEDPNSAELLVEALAKIRPCLIINKARREDDALLGKSIVDVVRKYLAIDLRFVGTVPYDEKVSLSLRNLTPYVSAHPHSKATYVLRVIADRLLSSESVGRLN